MEPIPVGTAVKRLSDGRRYTVTGHQQASENLFSQRERLLIEADGRTLAEVLAEQYPDGVAYQIFPEGMLQKFGTLRDYTIWRVRRGSVTPVEEES